ASRLVELTRQVGGGNQPAGSARMRARPGIVTAAAATACGEAIRISTCSGTCRSGAVYSYVVPGTSDGSASVSASGSAGAMAIAVAACSALSPTVTVTLPSLDVTLPAPGPR